MLISFSLSAQSDKQVAQLYEHYAKADETISFSLSHSILNAIDMDVDLESYTRHVEGDFETIRLVIFEKARSGQVAFRKIQNQLEGWGYLKLNIKEHGSDKNLKLFALKESGFYRHIVALVNDDGDDEALMLMFTGKLTVKPARS